MVLAAACAAHRNRPFRTVEDDSDVGQVEPCREVAELRLEHLDIPRHLRRNDVQDGAEPFVAVIRTDPAAGDTVGLTADGRSLIAHWRGQSQAIAAPFEINRLRQRNNPDFRARYDAEHPRMAEYLRVAGFDLRTAREDGSQFGFSAAGGRIAGHIDGVFLSGPLEIPYPCLWENKILNSKSFGDLYNNGLEKSKSSGV